MLLFLLSLLLLCVFAQFGPRGCHPKAPSLRGKQAQLGHAMLAQLAELGHAVLAQLGPTDQSIVNQSTNNMNKYMSK